MSSLPLRQRPVLPRLGAAGLLPVGGAVGASMLAGWLLTTAHARVVLVALAAAIAGSVLVGRPENGLLAGTALVLLVPSSVSLLAPQAAVPRVAAAIALVGLVVAAARRIPLDGRLGVIDCAAIGLAAASLISWALTPHPPNSLAAALNATLPLSFYAAARLFSPFAGWAILRAVVLSAAAGATTLIYELLVTRAPLFVDRSTYLWNANGDLIFRPGGVFGSPPAAATVLAMASICGFALVTRGPSSGRPLVWVALALCLVGEAITFTRAGLIGLAGGTLVYLVLATPRALGRLAYGAAIATLVVGLVVIPRIDETGWYQQGLMRRENLAARESYWRQAWPLITHSTTHAAVGHGINSLTIGRPELRGDPHPHLASAPILLAIGPHNQFVRTLFELGFVGLALLLAWSLGAVAQAARAARRAADEAHRSLLAAGAGSIAAFLLVSLAGDSLRNPASFALTSVLVGLVVAHARAERALR